MLKKHLVYIQSVYLDILNGQIGFKNLTVENVYFHVL